MPTLTHAYNCTKHESTGFSPFYVMFAGHPRLPVDILLGTAPDAVEPGVETSYTEYLQRLREQLEFAYRLAGLKAGGAQQAPKTYYDRKVRGIALEVGDRVLFRKMGLKGKQKLVDRWTEEAYVVQGRPSLSTPVYRVKPESRGGRSRVSHRNMLLPITSVPPRAEYLEEQEQQDSAEPAQRDEEEPRPGMESESDKECEVAVPSAVAWRPVPAPRRTLLPSAPQAEDASAKVFVPVVDPKTDVQQDPESGDNRDHEAEEGAGSKGPTGDGPRNGERDEVICEDMD